MVRVSEGVSFQTSEREGWVRVRVGVREGVSSQMSEREGGVSVRVRESEGVSSRTREGEGGGRLQKARKAFDPEPEAGAGRGGEFNLS